MISLIDVINVVDNSYKPVGHELKLLQDFPRLCGEKAEILASKEYLGVLKKSGKRLPCCVQSGKYDYSSLKILINYLVSMLISKGDILLYTIAPEALLWGIALYKGRKKIVVVTYEHWDKYLRSMLSDKPIRKFLVKKGLQKVDGYIVTNTQYKPSPKYIRIADYYVTKELEDLRKKEKKEGCVCLGEMRQGKDIAGLVQTLRKTEIPLLIAGAFQKQELYQKVKRLQTDNIRIENENLSYEKYLQYLSDYKYVILPYSATHYSGRTSGVLLEAVFVGAIPIAPKSLLEENHICGLGYAHISEIPDIITAYEKAGKSIHNSLDNYRVSIIRKKVIHFFDEIKKQR